MPEHIIGFAQGFAVGMCCVAPIVAFMVLWVVRQRFF